MIDLNKKVVVITGGAGLLGSEFVRQVALCNGIPVIAEINEKIGEEIKANLIKETGNRMIAFHKCDICDPKSIQNLINWLLNKYSTIDVLVNNAYPRNKNYGRHFFDVEYQDFSENISMNLGGYFLTSQQFAKHFLSQGNGHIINISSIYGVVPPRFEIYEDTKMSNSVEYTAIKSGLIHLTKYMAKYFKDKNIRVNTLTLGGLLDEQPESFLEKYKRFCLSKGMLNPADISGALVFLISDLSTYINGQNIIVDDGFTL